MNCWEYHVVMLREREVIVGDGALGRQGAMLEEELKRLGQNGWEVVSVLPGFYGNGASNGNACLGVIAKRPRAGGRSARV